MGSSPEPSSENTAIKRTRSPTGSDEENHDEKEDSGSEGGEREENNNKKQKTEDSSSPAVASAGEEEEEEVAAERKDNDDEDTADASAAAADDALIENIVTTATTTTATSFNDVIAEMKRMEERQVLRLKVLEERSIQREKELEINHGKKLNKLKRELLTEFAAREKRIVQYLGGKIASLEHSQLTLSSNNNNPAAYPASVYGNFFDDNNGVEGNNKGNNAIIAAASAAAARLSMNGNTPNRGTAAAATPRLNSNNVQVQFEDEDEDDDKYQKWKLKYDALVSHLSTHKNRYPIKGEKGNDGGVDFDLKSWVNNQKSCYREILLNGDDKSQRRLSYRRISLLESLPHWKWPKPNTKTTSFAGETTPQKQQDQNHDAAV